MEILSGRALPAGNVYCCAPVVSLTLSEDGHRPDVPLAARRLLLDALPPISRWRAELLDFPAWHLLRDTEAPVPAALVIEAAGLLAQRLMGWPVSFAGSELSGTASACAAGLAVFEARNGEAGLAAGDAAARLFRAMQKDEPDRLAERFAAAMEWFERQTKRVTPKYDSLAIARSAQRRGVPWSALPMLPKATHIRLGTGRYGNLLQGAKSASTSATGRDIAKYKQLANALLAAANIPVATQRTVHTLEQTLEAARWIGMPVVVKPTNGGMGEGVTVGVADETQVTEAFAHASAISPAVVVESLIPGDEYRLLTIGGRFVAACQRRPARIIGDGAASVRDLLDRENATPERRSHDLGPIELDAEALRCLADQGMSPDTVPTRDQVVILRRASNVSRGGDSVDVTDRVHPSIRDLAERTAGVLGLDICGIDFITTDLGRPYWETGGAICEVYAEPPLWLHVNVVAGTSRDAADEVVRMLFPDGAPCRIPVVAVLQEPRGSLPAMVHAAASTLGKRVALVTAGRIRIGSGEALCAPTVLNAVDAALLDGTLDGLVIGVTAHEIVHAGLGVEAVDLAIVPHRDDGAYGVAAETLARLAGGRVIRADDDRLMAHAIAALGEPGRTDGAASPSPTHGTARSTFATPRTPDSASGAYTVMLVGDVDFGESYMHHRQLEPLRRSLAVEGHRHSLVRLENLLGTADLLVGNLEVPLAPTIDPALERDRKKYLGWSDADETVRALTEVGFDAVSLANNHTLDCGESGLIETIRRLEEAAIVPFGAGATTAEARRPFVRRVRIGEVERTIVVFGCFEYDTRYAKRYSWYAGEARPGINPIEPKAIARRIERLRARLPAPYFIAFPHWGPNYHDTEDYQRVYARQLMEAGVDLIVGHGAHSLQGIEAIDGRPVIYGLGNLVWNTPGRFELFGAPPFGLAAALKFRWQGSRTSLSIRLYPLLIENSVTAFQTRPVSSGEFPDVLAALTPHFDQPDDRLVRGSDGAGLYVEIDLDTSPAPLTPPVELPAPA